MSRRHALYFAVRGAAALLFVLAATVLPRGVPAGMLILLAGLVGVGSCLFANAGRRPAAGPLVRLAACAAGRLAAVRRERSGAGGNPAAARRVLVDGPQTSRRSP
jgi:CHASE2 domain-containing sensor protein